MNKDELKEMAALLDEHDRFVASATLYAANDLSIDLEKVVKRHANKTLKKLLKIAL